MQNRHLARWLAVLVVSLSFVATVAGSNERQSSLTPDDQNAIRATIEAYRTTWLANNAQGVLKTLSDDAVLMPAHGTPAVVGIAAIEKYWFTHGGPITVVTGLDITIDEIDGNATLAFARGADRVTWTVTQGGVTHRHSHPGTYLNVMKKMPDGSWRIRVHMWEDGPETVD
jgi:uncharacterized protein (TIGR02246 family)